MIDFVYLLVILFVVLLFLKYYSLISKGEKSNESIFEIYSIQKIIIRNIVTEGGVFALIISSFFILFILVIAELKGINIISFLLSFSVTVIINFLSLIIFSYLILNSFRNLSSYPDNNEKLKMSFIISYSLGLLINSILFPIILFIGDFSSSDFSIAFLGLMSGVLVVVFSFSKVSGIFSSQVSDVYSKNFSNGSFAVKNLCLDEKISKIVYLFCSYNLLVMIFISAGIITIKADTALHSSFVFAAFVLFVLLSFVLHYTIIKTGLNKKIIKYAYFLVLPFFFFAFLSSFGLKKISVSPSELVSPFHLTFTFILGIILVLTIIYIEELLIRNDSRNFQLNRIRLNVLMLPGVFILITFTFILIAGVIGLSLGILFLGLGVLSVSVLKFTEQATSMFVENEVLSIITAESVKNGKEIRSSFLILNKDLNELKEIYAERINELSVLFTKKKNSYGISGIILILFLKLMLLNFINLKYELSFISLMDLYFLYGLFVGIALPLFIIYYISISIIKCCESISMPEMNPTKKTIAMEIKSKLSVIWSIKLMTQVPIVIILLVVVAFGWFSKLFFGGILLGLIISGFFLSLIFYYVNKISEINKSESQIEILKVNDASKSDSVNGTKTENKKTINLISENVVILSETIVFMIIIITSVLAVNK